MYHVVPQTFMCSLDKMLVSLSFFMCSSINLMWDTIILGGNLQTDSKPFVGDVFYTTTTCTEHKPFVSDVFFTNLRASPKNCFYYYF